MAVTVAGDDPNSDKLSMVAAVSRCRDNSDAVGTREALEANFFSQRNKPDPQAKNSRTKLLDTDNLYRVLPNCEEETSSGRGPLPA